MIARSHRPHSVPRIIRPVARPQCAQVRRRDTPPAKEPPATLSEALQPGMVVKTTESNLAAGDITQPHVVDVEQDAAGQVQGITLEKGAIFRKKVVTPVERIQQVDVRPTPEAPQGTVTIAASDEELADLSAAGTETLPPVASPDDEPHASDDEILLSRPDNPECEESSEPHVPPRLNVWRTIGPGLLSGLSSNDPSAVTTYAVAGAATGYSQLWLILLSAPLWQAILFACSSIGRVARQGLSELVEARFGRPLAVGMAVLVLLANIALISADLVAISNGLQLLSGITWEWFVLPVAVLLWYILVYRNFGTIKKLFLVLGSAFVAYLVTAFFAHVNWGAALTHTFVPHISWGFAAISSAVAILGATFSPYTLLWQVHGEIEEDACEMPPRQQALATGLDAGTGVLSSNLISYFIILCTSATIFAHHGSITTAADAARSMQPLLGRFGVYLFALGLIGAGMIAVPVVLASTAYVLSGSFGWAGSLWKKPWQTEGFYLILTAALVGSLVLALIGINPVQLMSWANILQSFLAPLLIALVLLIGNSRRIMGGQRLGWFTNVGLILAALVVLAGVVLLVAGLVTGAGG